ncbi:5-methylthioadenosine/S-adenosylhomocysteine deaminase [Butyrivibrio sp. ob235]|uniref:amidohydrolase family protein n=1 Tax=Butyrivibrio sp. ob235 TaxID=1761780 RepID=UPI0008B79839|nr:amidohydrolase [Butyrivibrio sp. ob235]SEK29906.1 5-methylthioadenosine/S-adenosylhomocysteine deaminase [Butyrivibrio sp. ob235]
MRIRFYNARILTMREGQEIFEGELWTSGDRIIYCDTTDQIEEYYKENPGAMLVFDREIDCKGNLLMPGFKNAHTHSAMTLLRSRADDLPLADWLNNAIFPVEAKLTAEDIYYLTKLAVLEYVSGGVTGIFDMYLTPESIADACRDTGMRCVQVGAVNNFSQSPELVEEMYNKLNGRDEYNSYILGFHAEYTCTKELLQKIADLAHKYKAPVFTHISETAHEVAECRERYNMSPVEFLDSLGMFDYGGGGYHLVHTDEKDMDILKKRGMFVVTNPGSNTKLASGIAPINDYLKKGIPVAIGTDGPASNNALSMFREMFLVTGLGKLRENDAACIDAMDVLKMATVNGAHAMGLNDADVLDAGKLADIIMLDLNKPNMQPINNICKNIVYSGSDSNVILTMIGGIIRYEKDEFNIGVSPEEIYKKASEIKVRIDKEL